MLNFTIQDTPESHPLLKTTVSKWLQAYPADSPGIVVPVYNARSDVLECVESLGRTTPAEVPVLLIDDHSTDAALPAALDARAERCGFCYIRKPRNSGFVNTVNLAFDWFRPRDVIIINSDTVLPPRWYERLRAAAYARTNVATATPLTNHGTIVSVPNWRNPRGELERGLSLEETDTLVERASLRLHPPLPTAVGHCVYFRRSALEKTGYFDQTFAPGYGEEVDFSQRAILSGFVHVAADDLFIHHKHNRSFGQPGGQSTGRLQKRHHPLLASRYPWYFGQIRRLRSVRESPLLRAISQARRAIEGYRIGIDCTGYHPRGEASGCPQTLVNVLTAAADHTVHVTLIVSDEVTHNFAEAAERGIGVVSLSAALESFNCNPPRFDILHHGLSTRHASAAAGSEFVQLASLARRSVVQLDDLSRYVSPKHHSDDAEWERYQNSVERTMATADGVIFATGAVAEEAEFYGLCGTTSHLLDIRPRVESEGQDRRNAETGSCLLHFYEELLCRPGGGAATRSADPALTAPSQNSADGDTLRKIRRALSHGKNVSATAIKRTLAQYVRGPAEGSQNE